MVRADRLLALSLVMVLGGIALLVWAGYRGEAELYLFIIFPVVTGSGAVFAVGVLIFIIGIPLLFMAIGMRSMEGMADGEGYQAAPPSRAPAAQPSQAQAPPPQEGPGFGGVVFIGPIPIVFGSQKRTGKLMLAGAIVFGILLIVFLVGLFL